MTQSAYRLSKHNHVHETMARLENGTLFKGDPICHMNEAELKDFWWYYTFNLLHRFGREGTGFNADDLIRANENTLDELERQNFEPRMGRLRMQYFSSVYLLPALADTISDKLKEDVLENIKKAYGL